MVFLVHQSFVQILRLASVSLLSSEESEELKSGKFSVLSSPRRLTFFERFGRNLLFFVSMSGNTVKLFVLAAKE